MTTFFQALGKAIEAFMGHLYPPKPTPMPLQPPVAPKMTPPSPVPTGFPPMIIKWRDAITIGEGATQESNNPGNLKYSTLTASWGATKGRQASDGGYLCQFATLQAGQTALCNFLTLACEGELIISHPWPCTLQDFTVRYAGNPPHGYIDGIATHMGVATSVLISSFL